MRTIVAFWLVPCSHHRVRAAWAVGFGVRFGLHVDPDSQGKYIAYYLFIVLSVCVRLRILVGIRLTRPI